MSKRQCKACPWKVSTRPGVDISGGYRYKKHRALCATIADPGSLRGARLTMACHESRPGADYVCVGWAINQLGPGNNIALRIRAMSDCRLQGLEADGPQHERFEDTLPRTKRRAKGR